jgi:hypothetical protein
VLLIVGMMSAMMWVHRHYTEVADETKLTAPLQIKYLGPPIVIVPIESWSLVSQRAMEFALTLSSEIHAVHVGTEEESTALRDNWDELVADPCAQSAGTRPNLVTLESPYRLVIKPILEYVMNTEADNPGRQIAVIVPELVERHWYHYPLHNQRAELLKALLLVKGSRNIVLINVPWYIKA